MSVERLCFDIKSAKGVLNGNLRSDGVAVVLNSVGINLFAHQHIVLESDSLSASTVAAAASTANCFQLRKSIIEIRSFSFSLLYFVDCAFYIK